MTRRQFLICSAAATAALLPAGTGPFTAGAAFAASGADYYLARKNELTADFRGVVEGASRFLEPQFGPDRTARMAREALANFDRLLPGLPDVGGENNLIAYIVPIASWYVAFYGPMRENGKTAEDVGRLLYELARVQYESTPRAQLRAMTERLFSPKYVDKLKEWAAWTRKREYPANWVATYVPGNGSDFDYGCDYNECALVKYLTAQGVPELAPYVCIQDFASSRAYDSGLLRTKTIATGDGVCDFRYKKGRPVTQDWSTEIVRIGRQRS